MLQQYVESLQGVEWLGLVSLLFAVAAFTSIVVWALRLNKHEVARRARLPLEGDASIRENMQ